MASAKIENVREGRRKRGFCYYDLCLPEPPLNVLKPCFPGSIWTWLADEKQRINPLLSFASAHGLSFCFIELPLSPPMSWSYFVLPHPAEEGSNRMAWWASASSQGQSTKICYQDSGIAASHSAPPPKGSFLLYHNMQVKYHSAMERSIAKLVCQNTSCPASPWVHLWDNFLHGKI